MASAARTNSGARPHADAVVRSHLREPLRFSDLTERRGLKLAALSHCVSRSHFGPWQRSLGTAEFAQSVGVFTPLYFVDFEVADVALDLATALRVDGKAFLARVLDADGRVRYLVREGCHTLWVPGADGARLTVARARLQNVFSRNDPDPARRRVTTLPPEFGLGEGPTRTTTLCTVADLVPGDRPPTHRDPVVHVWHFGQTDPNGHVHGMDYLRTTESYVADVLQARGHDLRKTYFSRARIVYRKPCFRGGLYQRVAWWRDGDPLLAVGAIYDAGDVGSGLPAVGIELTIGTHEDRPAR